MYVLLVKRAQKMKMNEILSIIEMLSHSQGFYGRLLRSIYELKQENETEYNELKRFLESQNFSDSLDVILFFEC